MGKREGGRTDGRGRTGTRGRAVSAARRRRRPEWAENEAAAAAASNGPKKSERARERHRKESETERRGEREEGSASAVFCARSFVLSSVGRSVASRFHPLFSLSSLPFRMLVAAAKATSLARSLAREVSLFPLLLTRIVSIVLQRRRLLGRGVDGRWQHRAAAGRGRVGRRRRRQRREQ